ncbi:MAG: hypothetical protein ACREBC_30210, partial [Pyrinomonadaceae bacterium]
MSAFAHRSNEVPAHEYEWLDFSDRTELSAASIWALEDDDETTIQTKRPAKSSEHVTTASSGESGQKEIGSKVRRLDESQILPGEASFATVVLNREIQPDASEASEQVAQTESEQSLEPKSDSRKRILDESDGLPTEASFATVIKHGPNATPSYSPLEEFHAKFKLTWKTLTMAAVVLFSLSAGVTLAVLKIAESVRSQPTVVTSQSVSAPRTEPVRLTLLTPSDSPVIASSKQKQATPHVTSAPVVTPQPEKSREEISSNRFPNATVSENSRQTAAEAANKKIPIKVSRHEAKAKSEVRGAATT